MICGTKHKSIPFYPLRLPPQIASDVQASHSEIFIASETPSQPTEALYGYEEFEVTMNNPYIYQCKKDCCIEAAVQQRNLNTWFRSWYEHWESTTCSRAYKGIQTIPSGRRGSKGSLANCPQNHFRRLESAGLKAVSPYRKGHRDQTTR